MFLLGTLTVPVPPKKKGHSGRKAFHLSEYAEDMIIIKIIRIRIRIISIKPKPMKRIIMAN